MVLKEYSLQMLNNVCQNEREEEMRSISWLYMINRHVCMLVDVIVTQINYFYVKKQLGKKGLKILLSQVEIKSLNRH